MQIVLVEPQIPPNTGNIARLCAATDTPLHLVRPLGFEITDRHLKRAGLDYWQWVQVQVHDSLDEFLRKAGSSRLFFFSKKVSRSYSEAHFEKDDWLVFGSEVSGLPKRLFQEYAERFYCIPMFNPNVRSINLASAVAIVAYEALRQCGQLTSGTSGGRQLPRPG